MNDSLLISAFSKKTIFLTGATGFVGKVFLARILQVVPNVEKIFVLIRNSEKSLFQKRFETEILQSEIFELLRQRNDAQELFSKIVAVEGDAFNAGVLSNSNVGNQLCNSVNVVVNCIGSIDLTESLREAVKFNLVTAANMIDFAQRIRHLEAFLHISTAYVNAYRDGSFKEEESPLLPGIDAEVVLKRVMLMSENRAESVAARIRGPYPNSHFFSKAVAEKLISQRKNNVPVVFLRPSLIGAAFQNPLPGWIDSNNGIGTLVLLIGIGLIQRAAVRAEYIVDIIPVDFVVNAGIVICGNLIARNKVEPFINIVSSSSNPVKWDEARLYCSEYWQNNTPRRALTAPTLSFDSSVLWYRMWFFTHHDVPAALSTARATLWPNSSNIKRASLAKRTTDALRSMHYTFEALTQKQYIFEQKFIHQLLENLPQIDQNNLICDANQLQWRNYIAYMCYGIHRYVLREQGVVPPTSFLLRNALSKDTTIASKLSFVQWLAPDMTWALSSSRDLKYAPRLKHHRRLTTAPMIDSKLMKEDECKNNICRGPRSPASMKNAVLSDERVRAEISSYAEGASAGRKYAEEIIDRMGHNLNYEITRVFAYFMRKIFRRIYTGIHVEQEGVDRLRAAVANGTVALLPTHRSYVDFLLISYICFEYDVPLPHIAAGEDFLAVLVVNWIFRNAGAFFIRRSFKDDPMYWAIFEAYVQTLVVDRCPIEFYIEGTRSRSGKALFPKLGMLSILVEPYVTGDIDDITIAPIAISYEKVLEAELYSHEMLGESKPKESLSGLLRARRVLALDFGRINVTFGEFLSVGEFSRKYEQDSLKANNSTRRTLIRSLGYEIIGRLNEALSVTATAILASCLLVYRRGIARTRLIRIATWLRDICIEKGAIVAFEGAPQRMVEYAFKVLSNLVCEARNGIVQPLLKDENGQTDQKPLLVLAYYRNQLLHLFFVDGLVAIVLHAFENGVSRSKLINELNFLRVLFATEFPTKICPCPLELFDITLQSFINKGFVTQSTNENGETIYNVSLLGNGHITFMCHLYWPFIDSYWVASMVLFDLVPFGASSKKALLNRMSWLCESLYFEKKIPFFESCSLDVMGNAFFAYCEQGLLEKRARAPKLDKFIKSVDEYQLTLDYQDGKKLQELVDRLGGLRQRAVVSRGTLFNSMTADYPVLARL